MLLGDPADLLGGQAQIDRVGVGLGHIPRGVAVALDPVAIEIVEIERPGVAVGDDPIHRLPRAGHAAVERLQVFERIHHEGNLLGDHLVLLGIRIARLDQHELVMLEGVVGHEHDPRGRIAIGPFIGDRQPHGPGVEIEHRRDVPGEQTEMGELGFGFSFIGHENLSW